MIRTVEKVFAYTVLSLLTLGGFVISYWLFFDTGVPIQSTSVSITDDKGIIRNEYKRGSSLFVTRHICYASDGTYVFSRYFENKQSKLMYLMPTGVSAISAGCRTSVNNVMIPPYVEPGLYIYRVTIHYDNNILVDGIYNLPTFEIKVTD